MVQLQESPTVAVVGAGLGGLATAIRLQAAGYRVTLFDRQTGPGGKAFTEQIGPYRFDTGPSLLTMKHVFDDLFAAASRSFDDYVTTSPLDPVCRYFWRDGTRFQTAGDSARLARDAAAVFGIDAGAVERFLAYSARIHRVTAHLFLERSLHEWPTYASAGFWRSLVQLPQIDALRTMDRAVASYFQEPHLRQLFDRYATYNGSSPYRTPATLNIIPHVEYAIGSHAVHGGIYEIPRAMDRVAEELGVRRRYGSVVERIEVDAARGPRGRAGGRVTGVRVAGVHEPFDVVVSNVDVTPTYRDLLQDTKAPRYRRYQATEPSSSGIVFYFGVKRRFPELGLHNIFFSDDYEREFREIFDEGRAPDDPTIYVNITAKEGAPGDAPADGENWFVLVNAPHDAGQDWEAEAGRVRRAVVERLGRELQCDLESLIEVEARLLPPDIEARTDSWGGSLYGISSNSRLAAFLRHPNRSRRYPGLFFVGGSAHPGGGMPLVVLGGSIVAGLVARHHPVAAEA